ncbi:MAPEG family protein [Kordiimonas marina]|uniref:MAPEG family protein n=1 Tax=Kordiimonas marina TaxID=2872312 RepID=UPI001FF4369F|nr:MAPEG family protein [Kordiimonas marina]MCJ9428446.1 MAPEG family protein [Kordiimonas marina]
MHITFITAAFTGLLYALLGLQVGRMRGVTKTSLGMGDDPRLMKAVRAHANLTEWAPITLIVLGASESLGAGYLEMMILGVGFFAARVLHAWGLLTETDKPNALRSLGAMGTAVILLWASVHTLILAYSL